MAKQEWTRDKLVRAYIEFFKSKKHREILNAPLMPENDPTVLFTTAGMHPLVPFLLGQKHPSGKRLVNVQRCIRTTDIDVVGDVYHLTFFEMLGNWSFGDYWKKEAIGWSLEFLIKVLGFKKEQIHVTCFNGDRELGISRDDEAAKAWMELGISEERIYFNGMEENWWGPAGKTGPCGPDTEMFIDTGREKCGGDCQPKCNCGKYFEIWNDVFMQYNKTADGKYEELKQKNVDTGMGVERTVAMLNNYKNVYELKEFTSIISEIKKYSEKNNEKAVRVITDHVRAAVFILLEKIVPGNAEQGYILRRLIRRAVRFGKELGIERNFLKEIAGKVIALYKDSYKQFSTQSDFILREIDREETKFRSGLEKGMNLFRRKVDELKKDGKKKLSGEDAFLLYQSYGFPIEMTAELGRESGIDVDVKEYEKEYNKHKELSRTSTAGRFRGGLSDHGEETTRLHTASHLLLAALNKVLGRRIEQMGSHITKERTRFDFTFDRKLTDEEVKRVEEFVNNAIDTGKEVVRKEMTLEEAKKQGAHGAFEHKYGERVSVYMIDGISKELCGGPHVKTLKELQGYKFRIIGQESVGAGARRVKGALEKKK